MKYIQRHGESETNISRTFTCRLLDPGLTELGRRQIKDLVPFYKTKGITQIISSPSKRAVESAQILSEGIGVEFRTNDCLLEVNIGMLEGKSEQDNDLLAQFYSIMNDWIIDSKNTRFPGGESFEEVKSRLKSIKSLLSCGNTVVVGHSALFAILLGTIGVAFNRIEELFLPRGGMAKYNQQSGTWRIETISNHGLHADAHKTARL